MSNFNSNGLAIAPGMDGHSQQPTQGQQAAHWGQIAQAFASFGTSALGFLPNNRDANVAIAQANAEAERARAEAAALNQRPQNNTTLIVVAVIAIIIIIALMMRK